MVSVEIAREVNKRLAAVREFIAEAEYSDNPLDLLDEDQTIILRFCAALEYPDLQGPCRPISTKT